MTLSQTIVTLYHTILTLSQRIATLYHVTDFMHNCDFISRNSDFITQL